MRLGDVRREMTSVVADVDPRLLTLDDAKTALADVVTIRNLAGLLEGRLARRVAEASEWRRAGFSSPEAWLAHQTGTSAGRAKEALETAERIERLPDVAEAAERGDLSVEQAALIADAATANPAAARSLLAGARVLPLGKLRDAAANAKRSADPDPEATHARLRAARALRFGRALDGASKAFGLSTPEQIAPIQAAVEKRGNELFDQARREGRREPREAYLMDALEQICREWLDGHRRVTAAHALQMPPRPADAVSADAAEDPAPSPRSTSSPAWLGLLRIDVEALQRGAVEGEELCEIAGIGPVPISVARRLLGESVLKLVITRGVDVLNVTHLGRAATVAQRMALLWSSPGCCITGCSRIAGIEIDHRAPWAATRRTVLEDLQRFCDHHHDLKTRDNWAAVRTAEGVIEMVPPADPRHPSQSRAGPPAERPPPDAHDTADQTDTLFDEHVA